jgi:hypothetical protein
MTSPLRPLVVGLLLTAHGAAWAQAALPPAPPLRSPPPSSVPLAALRADPPVQAPLTPDQRRVQRRRALRHFALAGVATVLAGAGVFFGLRSKSTYDGALSDGFQAVAYDHLVESRRQAIIADVAFAGAGLALAGAVVSYVFFRVPPPPPEDAIPPPPPADLPPPEDAFPPEGGSR